MYEPQFELVRRAEKPILGICAGFHVVNCGHGGVPVRYNNKFKGLYGIKIEEYDPLVANFPIHGRIFVNHRWVADQVAPELDVIARLPYALF